MRGDRLRQFLLLYFACCDLQRQFRKRLSPGRLFLRELQLCLSKTILKACFRVPQDHNLLGLGCDL